LACDQDQEFSPGREQHVIGDQAWPIYLFVKDMDGDVSLDDIDADGDLDIVLAGMGIDKIIWYENKLNEWAFSYRRQGQKPRAWRDGARPLPILFGPARCEPARLSLCG
jgi:hypothetical protein